MEESHLSSGSATHWSNVFDARQAEGDKAVAARNALLLRYYELVLRFLQAELRDEHAAGQICSNFAVRVLEAERFLQLADPQRGRFRDYLKAVLRHMVADYHRERQRENKKREKLTHGDNEPAASATAQEEENQRFLSCWRHELVNRALGALEQVERRTGQLYAALLRLQSAEPGLRSPQLAERLTAQLNRPFTAAGVRQLTHRAHELLGDLLVAEVARSLQVDAGDPDGATRVEQELIELGLLFSYCKQALDRCRPAR